MDPRNGRRETGPRSGPLVTTPPKSPPSPRIASGDAGSREVYYDIATGEIVTPALFEEGAECEHVTVGRALRHRATGALLRLGCEKVNCPEGARRDGRLKVEVVRQVVAARGEPAIVATLTTQKPYTAPRAFMDDCAHVLRAIRRRHPDARWLAFIEHTTGEGARSGGHRRIHLHALVWGVPADEADPPGYEPRKPARRARAAPDEALGDTVRRVWHARTGAHRVLLERVGDLGGSIAYVAEHHMKPEQLAPAGWRGRRLRASKGLYPATGEEMKERAKKMRRGRGRARSAWLARRDWLAEYEEQGVDLVDVEHALAEGLVQEPEVVRELAAKRSAAAQELWDVHGVDPGEIAPMAWLCWLYERLGAESSYEVAFFAKAQLAP